MIALALSLGVPGKPCQLLTVNYIGSGYVVYIRYIKILLLDP